MNVIAYYTDSHKDLFESFFLPSLDKVSNFKVISKKGVQHSLTGEYNSIGFNESTKDKISFLLDQMKKIEKFETLLFCDVDLIFLDNPVSYFDKYQQFDMVFQNGYTELNTGFFLLKNKDKVVELLQNVIENIHNYNNDQDAINDLIQKTTLKYTYFDNKIACPATYNGLKIWDGEDFEINSSPIVFHACWCSGVENKKKLLNIVKNYK